MAGAKDKTGFLREGLFAKYVVSLVGLVVFVLAVNGATETWISYRATKTSLTDALSEKADATAKRIDQSVFELVRQISWVTRASQLTLLNGEGHEMLRLSRTRITVNSNADFSRDLRFTETVARGVNFSPAFFEGSRPFMSISVSHSGF